MTSQENNQKLTTKSKRYRVGKILETWWFKVLEVVAFIILIPKLLPEKWLANAKETGWALIILLGLSILSLLIINYLLTLGYAKEIGRREYDFSEKLTSLIKENEILEKKSRYADVIPMLTVVFQTLHSAIRRDHSDKLMYHEAFAVCCENLEKVFSKITGEECHICIKMTVFPSDQIQSYQKYQKNIDTVKVRTYCRSSSSSPVRRQVDDQKQISHLINENTDFEFIYKNRGDSFFCNDLAMLDEYKNSSLKFKHGSCTYFPKGTPYEQKVKDWPLEYRSAIVAPIVPIIKEAKDEHIILGLLCVDCKVPGVFNDGLDRHIMIGCADGVYNSFKKLFTPNDPSSKQKIQNHGKES